MKHVFLTLMIVIPVGGLMGCAKTLPDTHVNKDNSGENKVAVLEKTVKRQEEEIARLKAGQDSHNDYDPIAEALLQGTCKSCKKDELTIKVSGDVVQIYFNHIMKMAGFLDGDPETRAHQDLGIFLEETGYKTGTIEYYTPPSAPTKIFSISGSLSDAKTKRYH